jgi:pimeloyl-ACP methyl ester carboxylesterase
LVLQGLDDVLAPPENARILKAELGDQVTVVDIPQAGHAMLPEQPQLIAKAVTRYASARLT